MVSDVLTTALGESTDTLRACHTSFWRSGYGMVLGCRHTQNPRKKALLCQRMPSHPAQSAGECRLERCEGTCRGNTHDLPWPLPCTCMAGPAISCRNRTSRRSATLSCVWSMCPGSWVERLGWHDCSHQGGRLRACLAPALCGVRPARHAIKSRMQLIHWVGGGWTSMAVVQCQGHPG